MFKGVKTEKETNTNRCLPTARGETNLQLDTYTWSWRTMKAKRKKTISPRLRINLPDRAKGPESQKWGRGGTYV